MDENRGTEWIESKARRIGAHEEMELALKEAKQAVLYRWRYTGYI